MRNRRFGVELEFSSNGHRRGGVGDALVNAGLQHWVGTRSERYSSISGGYVTTYSGIGSDGSELELRSPILQGTQGFKEVKKVVETLNRLGCYVTENDGLHVHHDAPEFVGNKELLLKLLKSWEQNQDHISTFIEPRRANRSGGPCGIIRKEQINMFESSSWGTLENQIYRDLPRGSLNCQALPEHGSLEFRYMEGTLYWEQVESWIKFGQSFLDGVLKRKNPINKAPTPVVLMNRLKTSKKAKHVLAGKAISHGYNTELVGVI